MRPWAKMWWIAFAMYLFFKALHFPRGADWKTKFLFLLVWPGMNADDLRRGRPHKVALIEWVWALGKTLLGLALLFVFPRHLPLSLQGWSGVFGFIFLLHFGVFHVIALLLMSLGYGVRKIMNAPLFATSVADFWGRRWNMAFRDLAHGGVFKPAAAKLGFPAAILITFLFSGLVHECVISVPVMAGFGLPTLYFLIQGTAMVLERGRENRIFTLAVTLLPVPLLFHRSFLDGVIVPFLHAIGGLP